MDDIQYYCVGFTWNDSEDKNQLSRFLKEGIWENGFEDRYLDRVKSISKGSRIAAKTTYTKRINNKSISILAIHATGTVTKNYLDGHRLKVKWDKKFEPFEIENKGAYRSTISRINQFDLIIEIFKDDKFLIESNNVIFYSSKKYTKENYIYPCFVLTKDRWDDFGYKTLYDVDFFNSSNDSVALGRVKFLNSETDDGDLPETFTRLDDHICSLGQSNQYYLNLRTHLDQKISDYYLDSVNDVAINKGTFDSFEHEEGFKVSLLRDSEAQKALREGNKIYKNLKIDNIFKFSFSTQLDNAIEKHKIKFNYSDIADLPFRIKVLIGKNGTGKTQYISRLASTLSGYKEQGEFNTEYLPPFSRVIAVSYSLFDRFPRPKQTKTFSYYYCGFQSGKGFLTDNQINVRLSKALNILEKSKRLHLFGEYISLVLSDDIALDFMDEDFTELTSRGFSLYNGSGSSSKYSSGQIVMILMLAEVIAYITEESFLLFDEPETHLHPNSISLFINVINRLLKKYNSYAIISTHSPQIIQEIPSKDIIVLERLGNVPTTRGLDIETFGENLNTITERIFHTTNHDEYYREFLLNISKIKSYEEVIKMFEKSSLPLSLSTKIYLGSLYK